MLSLAEVDQAPPPPSTYIYYTFRNLGVNRNYLRTQCANLILSHAGWMISHAFRGFDCHLNSPVIRSVVRRAAIKIHLFVWLEAPRLCCELCRNIFANLCILIYLRNKWQFTWTFTVSLPIFYPKGAARSTCCSLPQFQNRTRRRLAFLFWSIRRVDGNKIETATENTQWVNFYTLSPIRESTKGARNTQKY